jgi:hypothetical protein
MMGRLLLILPSVLWLAGCAGNGGLTPLPAEHARATFRAGSDVNVIKIDVLDNLPLRAAELVAPDGSATPASWLDVNNKLQANGGSQAISSPWRSDAAFGDVAPTMLPNPGANVGVYASHTELLMMSAGAQITLPDPVAYRRDWKKYKIRLTFGAPGAPTIREIAAPQPPPG